MIRLTKKWLTAIIAVLLALLVVALLANCAALDAAGRAGYEHADKDGDGSIDLGEGMATVDGVVPGGSTTLWGMLAGVGVTIGGLVLKSRYGKKKSEPVK